MYRGKEVNDPVEKYDSPCNIWLNKFITYDALRGKPKTLLPLI
jgi:hypothetical protein